MTFCIKLNFGSSYCVLPTLLPTITEMKVKTLAGVNELLVKLLNLGELAPMRMPDSVLKTFHHLIVFPRKFKTFWD